ncbi:pyruvate dehydrogenase, decarboxylase component E1, thiamin-binding (plasmid) [Cupriavidus taiwanensis]|uniref:Pyruvate dehydrogenase E1 component n=1 Tax=Cupriavidus taiwanensis TaxID=164546 RepID=A0A375HEU8_9BURK|nr:alpha-ketoglutarate dehydrogenase [Cupriavidus taiwanensis]SOZ71426.1 pyruvate dehydrogenase, decarboxylase component E1, thiamin-binding [Cupriavidus taiwanensis]SOZ72487.1 pyruvate dehydrogenase, decarboxylase component E1, thiamin-binding [Cupriavidus taiwanensis]SOZ74923.1 pyruvate dehydrogenase, decarboxylase component E1, thiamin-binding [Cupriavidus taiwanensis]SPA03350.1 pyruvate dehydrogenase, decarboxylase component E1, thiamin-binding [Cupriavidus taiwanensis]SPA11716.1 pyruvate 
MNTPTTPLLQDAIAAQQVDLDPVETTEWREAFIGLIQAYGPERGKYILDELARLARDQSVGWQPNLTTPYVNTISVDAQPKFPGDLAIEERLGSMIRWNALAMVVRANQAYGELGGHIASYASAADLFETGFNHFFRADDLVFFQAHSAPGVYARAFLEGRLSEADLAHYRQEIVGPRNGARGLSSYPHPWLMPDFWQFPTGSMGIGPISSIYHARFMRYLAHRGLLQCENRTVWGVFGDGEMDEPESMSALTLAAREKLDNLVWVVNCNLQRLDGPVRGNGRIIDELERLFSGAGWSVIKLLWGSDWDGLFARDANGALTQALGDTVDGQMQTFAAKDGRFNREHFFGQNPQLALLAQGMTDEQIDRLKRGGHDLVKIYAAYAKAAERDGRPTVILAHTKKGYGMGAAGQGRMTTHSQKKLDDSQLIEFRNRFNLPLTDDQATSLTFLRPEAESDEMRYMRSRREGLGGALPKRNIQCGVVAKPALASYARFAVEANGKEMSTTMAFVRLLGQLLKDKELGPRIVPIVADEARTFGMANLFKQVAIYSSVGQRYDPEDIGSVLAYREAFNGQILEEGISEAGAIASWTAAATSYSVHGLAMLPFYIYYSMFGFQRIGDAIWAAADQRARGFLLGATSGRTTLGGEGLQHQDGTSHLVAATIPNCKAYDPAFAAEMAVIVDAGIREMMLEQQDVFYYVTLMNESYAQPNLSADVEAAILRGCYKFDDWQRRDIASSTASARQVTLMGSGAILTEVIKAAQQLASEGIDVSVYSVTSWSELARDGALHRNRELLGEASNEIPFLQLQLEQSAGPIIAATDYVRAVPESVREYVPTGRRYLTLGTDGFGRSDTRGALREYFGVDAASIVRAAKYSLD